MSVVKKFIDIYTFLMIPIMIAASFLVVWIFGRIENHRIRKEVFEYVLSNKDTIILDSNKYQEFFYTATGLQDGGTEYGYYYAPNDDYNIAEESYGMGYRTYGIPDDPFDWYYEERICEHWFYYEIHDG